MTDLAVPPKMLAVRPWPVASRWAGSRPIRASRTDRDAPRRGARGGADRWAAARDDLRPTAGDDEGGSWSTTYRSDASAALACLRHLTDEPALAALGLWREELARAAPDRIPRDRGPYRPGARSRAEGRPGSDNAVVTARTMAWETTRAATAPRAGRSARASPIERANNASPSVGR